MADFIPRKDSEFVSWVSNFITHIAENAHAWGIPADEVAGLRITARTFTALYTQAYSPTSNSVIVAKKNAARAALVTLIRALKNFRLENPVITDAQRIAMGLHVRDAKLSTISAPTYPPEFNIVVLDVRRLSIRFHNQGSTSRAKPYGIIGAMIVYATLDSPPDSPSALICNVLATRTPYVIEFTEKERGKKVYVAICWVNGKGEKGPWSEIKNAIVP
jgi:hypothetical protein